LNHIEIYKYKSIVFCLGEEMRKSYVIIGVLGIIALLTAGFIIGTLFIGSSQYSRNIFYDDELKYSSGYTPAQDGAGISKVPTQSYSESQELNSKDRKIVKNGNARIEVENFNTAISKIKELASNNNGYVTNSNMWISDSNRKNGNITVKIPEEKFEQFSESLIQIGKIESKEISSFDVTEEYIDLQARLKNLKIQEKRYTELLAMAKDVNDVLAIEAQLGRIRGEIESYEGRIKYLENTTSYGTFNINIYEPEEVVHEFGLKKAFDRAIDAFIVSVAGIIILAGFLIPIILVLGVLYFAIKYIKKRFYKK